MAGTVHDFFTTDTRTSKGGGTLGVEWTKDVTVQGQSTGRSWKYPIQYRLVFDYQANASYLHIFVPELQNGVDVVQFCVNLAFRFRDTPLEGAPPPVVQNSINLRLNPADRRHPTLGMVYSRHLVFYMDSVVDESEKEAVYARVDQFGIFLKIRDRGYAIAASKESCPVAFVSHDSRDKDAIARPIAAELSSLVGRVWFDEYSLKIGDSLRESIESGLKQSRYCVLVLTKNFLSNKGWARTEFDSVFTREIHERRRLILPVWSEVSKYDVFEYCPSLADRFSADWALGCDVVARRLRESMLDL